MLGWLTCAFHFVFSFYLKMLLRVPESERVPTIPTAAAIRYAETSYAVKGRRSAASLVFMARWKSSSPRSTWETSQVDRNSLSSTSDRLPEPKCIHYLESHPERWQSQVNLRPLLRSFCTVCIYLRVYNSCTLSAQSIIIFSSFLSSTTTCPKKLCKLKLD